MAKKKASKPAVLDRKEKIVNAAIELFIEHGAAFTKLNDVAKKAKVPAPLIHYYFKDIEDLHMEIIVKAMNHIKEYSLREAVKVSHDPMLMMKEYIKGPLLWAHDHPDLMSIWMYFYYMASFSEKFKALDTQIRVTGRERISMMIYQGIEKGVFKIAPKDSVKDLAQEVQAIMSGQTILYATEAKNQPIQYYIQQTTHRIFQFLGVKS